ncbi:MAG: PD-(D/E)XK nuclease family protein [Clostridia bacterium]|nr:PD-(D/E)XK nuclease family protein [Clostridia bacterium]
MLKLILGGAGSGKTTLITEMIKKDIESGKRAILIVPEQETVAREKEMLTVLPPSAQLSFEVLNFTRLANSVFRKYGGLTYNYITDGVKALAMWNTLRALSPLLSEYGKTGNDSTFSSVMLSQIEEFKAYGVSPMALERAAAAAEDDSRIKAKLFDMSLIYSAYSASLESFGGGDPSDDVGKLASKLKEHRFFDGTSVYIDSFTSFTKSEENVILEILKQAELTALSLCIEGDESDGSLQFASIAQTLKKLERLAEKADIIPEKIYLSGNKRTEKEALRYLCDNIWRFDSAPLADGDIDCVRLMKCTNVYEEAEAATACVSELVQSGMRYRDIVILARNVGSYEGIIDNALEKADIPYFMSKSTDVSSMPLAKLILCALRIKNNGWKTEDVITYLKTGLTGLEERDADLFEQYIWKWSIKGKAFLGDDWTMDPFSYSSTPSKEGEKVLATVNECKNALTEPLCALFDALDTAEDNKAMCTALFAYMESLSLSEKMKEFSDVCLERGDRQMADEALRLYNTILDVLEVIASYESDEGRYDCSEFEQAMRIVLSEASLGSIPTSCDEVTVGSAALLRANKPKCAIIIGINDGIFPENANGNKMLTDEDKLFLAENGIELSPMSEENASEELFYFYRAISAPSEKLILTYSASELQGGKEMLPSLAFNRTSYLLGLKAIDYASLPYRDKLWSKKVAFEYSAMADGEDGHALRKYFSESDEFSSRFATLYTPIGERKCTVPEEISDLVFGKRMNFSPSALEKYVKCHFDYWCKYVLKLRPDEKNLFSISDTGSMVHAIIEKFIKAVTDENGFNAKKAEEEAEELIKQLMELYIEENIPEKDAAREQVAHSLSKLKHLTGLLAKNITEELKTSKFTPKFFELEINADKPETISPLVFKLKDGTSVSIKGFVDRVDLWDDGEYTYVKVVDYKTGSKEFRLEDIEEGLNLQMLLYLFSICYSPENNARLGCHGKLKEAGVVYLTSKVSGVTEKSGTSVDTIKKDAEEKLTRSGIILADDKVEKAINEDIKYVMSGYGGNKRKKKEVCFKTEEEFSEIRNTAEKALTTAFTELRGGNATIEPKKYEGKFPCEYCDMKAVCRRAHIKTEYENDEYTEGGDY